MSAEQPQIFLSFAGADRKKAQQLAVSLKAHGVRSFVDTDSIEFGENVVAAISRALGQSDYYVLLWSQHTANRRWVTHEWTGALYQEVCREVAKQRTFLFLVRLDNSPVPELLAPRRYLDASSDDWTGVAAALARAWERDCGAYVPVLPAPEPPAKIDAEPMELYIHNRIILPVSHVVTVPKVATGAELPHLVATALRLPTTVAAVADIVGTRFRYAFQFAGRPVADGPLADQGVTNASAVNMLVSVDIISRGELVSSWTLRAEEAPDLAGEADPRLPAELSRKTLDILIAAAFKHLQPW